MTNPAPHTPLPELLRPDEVAQLLRLSRPMIYKMAAEGILPSITFGRALRFDPADVKALIDSRRRGVCLSERGQEQ